MPIGDLVSLQHRGRRRTEALSGLARAFFCVGARSLLVSHWEVSSNSTVKLITNAVAELKTDPKIGRAEVLRRPTRREKRLRSLGTQACSLQPGARGQQALPPPSLSRSNTVVINARRSLWIDTAQRVSVVYPPKTFHLFALCP
jgi:hypothetical protein